MQWALSQTLKKIKQNIPDDYDNEEAPTDVFANLPLVVDEDIGTKTHQPLVNLVTDSNTPRVLKRMKRSHTFTSDSTSTSSTIPNTIERAGMGKSSSTIWN